MTRAKRPRYGHLSQLCHCDYKLELPLGIGVVHTSDQDRLADGKQSVAGEVDLSHHWRPKGRGIRSRRHIQVADLAANGKHQLIPVRPQLRPDLSSDVQVLVTG